MKIRITILALTFTFLCLLPSSHVNSQTTASAVPTSPFKVTADLVSSYYWRGVVSSYTPNFQPTFSFTKGNLEIGIWGSTSFDGKYKEADLYASYTMGPLKITVTDYDWYFYASKYFDYKSKTTGHIFEGTIGYNGPATFPISITANAMFAGADKKFDANSSVSPFTGINQDPSKQAYSTYIEFGYAFKYCSPFLGITPADGYYGDGYGGNTGFSVCNVGITSIKNLKISDAFSLPLKATLGFNPQKEDVYLVFGITF